MASTNNQDRAASQSGLAMTVAFTPHEGPKANVVRSWVWEWQPGGSKTWSPGGPDSSATGSPLHLLGEQASGFCIWLQQPSTISTGEGAQFSTVESSLLTDREVHLCRGSDWTPGGCPGLDVITLSHKEGKQ